LEKFCWFIHHGDEIQKFQLFYKWHNFNIYEINSEGTHSNLCVDKATHAIPFFFKILAYNLNVALQRRYQNLLNVSHLSMITKNNYKK